jgi:hypothetical protein
MSLKPENSEYSRHESTNQHQEKDVAPPKHFCRFTTINVIPGTRTRERHQDCEPKETGGNSVASSNLAAPFRSDLAIEQQWRY